MGKERGFGRAEGWATYRSRWCWPPDGNAAPEWRPSRGSHNCGSRVHCMWRATSEWARRARPHCRGPGPGPSRAAGCGNKFCKTRILRSHHSIRPARQQAGLSIPKRNLTTWSESVQIKRKDAKKNLHTQQIKRSKRWLLFNLALWMMQNCFHGWPMRLTINCVRTREGSSGAKFCDFDELTRG